MEQAIPGLTEFQPNPKVQRFRRAPANSVGRDEDVTLTSVFYQATYGYYPLYCPVDCQEGRAIFIAGIITNSILQSLNGSDIVAHLPTDLDMQPTFSVWYKDPDLLDESLGIGQEMVIPADTVDKSQMQTVNENNNTVMDIKSSIMDKLKLDTTDLTSFNDVDVDAVSKVLGDSMVESVNAFFIIGRVFRFRALLYFII